MHTQLNEACNDGQISHHRRDERSFCCTQTLTRAHPQFSQADTSIRLIPLGCKTLHSFSLNQRCWRYATSLYFMSCITSEWFFPSLFLWRRRKSRMIGSSSRQRYGGKGQEKRGVTRKIKNSDPANRICKESACCHCSKMFPVSLLGVLFQKFQTFL